LIEGAVAPRAHGIENAEAGATGAGGLLTLDPRAWGGGVEDEPKHVMLTLLGRLVPRLSKAPAKRVTAVALAGPTTAFLKKANFQVA
jgi:hypothetical protein